MTVEQDLRLTAVKTGVPDVSVIVAVYNVMPYLNRCLDSLVKQSIGLDRMEIVAVDDGSTDGSGARLDRLARRYPKSVTVIHQANSGGPAMPSNRALDIATGRYVFFIGADDYLGKEALERLVTAADQYGSDVVAGRMVGVNGRFVPQEIFASTQIDVDLYNSALPFAVSNTKLFRRELLEQHGIRYPGELPFGSDQPFTVAACVHAKRITVLADYDYYFAVSRKSRANITFSSTHQDRLDCTAKIMAGTARVIEPGPSRDAVHRRSFASEVWKLIGDGFIKLDRKDQEELCAGIARLCDTYLTPGIEGALDVRRRVRIGLARRSLVDELVKVIRTDRSRAGLEVVHEDDRVYANYPCFRGGSDLPDDLFLIADDPLHAIPYRLRVDKVSWKQSAPGRPTFVIEGRLPADLAGLGSLEIEVSTGSTRACGVLTPDADAIAVRFDLPIAPLLAEVRKVGARVPVTLTVRCGDDVHELPFPVRRLGRPRVFHRRGFTVFRVAPARNGDKHLQLDVLPFRLDKAVASARKRGRTAMRRLRGRLHK